MIIAIDFDGTIVENDFPKIGKPLPFAFEVIKELQEKGHNLILWTFRDGIQLREAVEFCKDNGIEFYAVNHSFPNENFDLAISRKIYADIYIDDKNVGGFPGWQKIRKILIPDSPAISADKGDTDTGSISGNSSEIQNNPDRKKRSGFSFFSRSRDK